MNTTRKELIAAKGADAAKTETYAQRTQILGGVIGYKFDKKLSANLAYWYSDRKSDLNGAGVTTAPGYGNISSSKTNSIVELNVGYKLSKSLYVFAEYLHGSEDFNDGGKNGGVVGLKYGNLNRAKPGSYLIGANYFNLAASNVINTSLGTFDPGAATTSGGAGKYFNGFEGFSLTANYVLVKNIDAAVEYYDFEGRNNNTYKQKALYSYLRFYF